MKDFFSYMIYGICYLLVKIHLLSVDSFPNFISFFFILTNAFSKGEKLLQWWSTKENEICIKFPKTSSKFSIWDYQPIAFLKVEGKIFFSLTSKRLESHLVQNSKVIYLYIQKYTAWENFSLIRSTYPWFDLFSKKPGLRIFSCINPSSNKLIFFPLCQYWGPNQ